MGKQVREFRIELTCKGRLFWFIVFILDCPQYGIPTIRSDLPAPRIRRIGDNTVNWLCSLNNNFKSMSSFKILGIIILLKVSLSIFYFYLRNNRIMVTSQTHMAWLIHLCIPTTVCLKKISLRVVNPTRFDVFATVLVLKWQTRCFRIFGTKPKRLPWMERLVSVNFFSYQTSQIQTNSTIRECAIVFIKTCQ